MPRPLPYRVVSLLVGLLAVGCATHADRILEVRALYHSGETDGAQTVLAKLAEKYPRDEDALALDRAIVLLVKGHAQEAEKILRAARDRLEYLEQKDIAEGALSMLTDDQRLAYAGADYERILIRAFLALASMLGDGQDAAAYSLQVAEKQQQIIEAGKQSDGKNPKEEYSKVALGPYLQAVVREATHANYDDAAHAIEQVALWEPDFACAKPDLERVKQGHHSDKGNGVVYVFTLVGRGPFKEERMEIPTTLALLAADRILTFAGKRSLPPTVAPIKVPRIEVPVNEVQTVRVAIDGQPSGETVTITDVGKLARQQEDVMFPYVLGRAIARRAVKKGVVYGAKEVAKIEGTGLANVAFDVAGVVWEATEAADTRCWGLLPERIQVLRLELPAGQHALALEGVDNQGAALGPAATATIAVEDGRNTYVLASFPRGRLVGRVVAGGMSP